MYDFAIIGSGVAGGRLAFDLTMGGASCVLLEAGREFAPETFPENELDTLSQMFWGSGQELSRDGRIGLLRGKCLGGTSVVNQSIVSRFDELALNDWKDRTGIPFFNPERFEFLYQDVEETLSLAVFTRASFNHNAEIFTRGLDRLGFSWKTHRRGHKNCALEKGSDCMACMGGCKRESKQSSLITTIRRARELGLTVISEFEVERVIHNKDSVSIEGSRKGSADRIVARKTVLAAGSIGTTGILLRSGIGEKLPALGQGMTCHPQVTMYGVFDQPIDAHKGAVQTVKAYDSSLRNLGLKIENGFAPPIGTAMAIPGRGRRHQQRMSLYRHLAAVEVAIQDDPSGTIRLGRDGKTEVDKSLTGADKKRLKIGTQVARELLEVSGSRETFVSSQTLGLHPMGGCGIGNSPNDSVVSPNFSVHGLPNIFAADSSIFPSAPGINPSLTIMALAHKASEELLRR